MIEPTCFPFTSVSIKNLSDHLKPSPLFEEFLEDLPSILFDRSAHMLTEDALNLSLLFIPCKDKA
jgi:hypothetical protein